MSDDRKPMFVECLVCGERWKLVTVPIEARTFARALKSAMCPHCAERKRLAVCPTDGPDAVTAPRAGRLPKGGA